MSSLSLDQINQILKPRVIKKEYEPPLSIGCYKCRAAIGQKCIHLSVEDSHKERWDEYNRSRAN